MTVQPQQHPNYGGQTTRQRHTLVGSSYRGTCRTDIDGKRSRVGVQATNRVRHYQCKCRTNVDSNLYDLVFDPHSLITCALVPSSRQLYTSYSGTPPFASYGYPN